MSTAARPGALIRWADVKSQFGVVLRPVSAGVRRGRSGRGYRYPGRRLGAVGLLGTTAPNVGIPLATMQAHVTELTRPDAGYKNVKERGGVLLLQEARRVRSEGALAVVGVAWPGDKRSIA